MHAQADESRGGSCFPHLYGKIKAAEKLSEAQKLLRQKEREERKQVYSVPGLLTTTCMCPPVVSKIAHTKNQYPGGIKTNPKIIFEK